MNRIYISHAKGLRVISSLTPMICKKPLKFCNIGSSIGTLEFNPNTGRGFRKFIPSFPIVFAAKAF